MKINYINYNLNSRQNFNSNKITLNSNNKVSFSGKYGIEHLTNDELRCLSSYAAALKGNIIPENMKLGPTFDIIEKVMKLDSPFSSLQEFLQLTLRAENEITNKMILKGKYFSALCAERYPKENYAKDVDKALNQIEKSEPIVLKELSANPLWNYTDVLREQKNWISVKDAIIKECDKREARINAKIAALEARISGLKISMQKMIEKERHASEQAIDRITEGNAPNPRPFKMDPFCGPIYDCDIRFGEYPGYPNG